MWRAAHSRRPASVVRSLLQAVIALGLAGILPGHASAQPAAPCVAAGLKAQGGSILPSGLLLAVASVESGRWDPQQARVEPWPWVIDVAGQPRFFPDKQAAVQATQTLLDAGQRNIDVGCFQISLLHHPFAFANLDQAFDPDANAQYAAEFLTSLHSRFGNWADAVAAYHSADPAIGEPYRKLVFAAWQPLGGEPQVTVDPRIHIWTPRAAGDAPQIISLGSRPPAHALRLPRVITLAR